MLFFFFGWCIVNSYLAGLFIAGHVSFKQGVYVFLGLIVVDNFCMFFNCVLTNLFVKQWW